MQTPPRLPSGASCCSRTAVVLVFVSLLACKIGIDCISITWNRLKNIYHFCVFTCIHRAILLFFYDDRNVIKTTNCKSENLRSDSRQRSTNKSASRRSHSGKKKPDHKFYVNLKIVSSKEYVTTIIQKHVEIGT